MADRVAAAELRERGRMEVERAQAGLGQGLRRQEVAVTDGHQHVPGRPRAPASRLLIARNAWRPCRGAGSRVRPEPCNLAARRAEQDVLFQRAGPGRLPAPSARWPPRWHHQGQATQGRATTRRQALAHGPERVKDWDGKGPGAQQEEFKRLAHSSVQRGPVRSGPPSAPGRQMHAAVGGGGWVRGRTGPSNR